MFRTHGIAILRGTLLVLFPAPVLAQQYAGERIPFVPGSGTAGQSQLIHGDIDGDGARDLVVRDLASSDFVLRGGAGGYALVESVGHSNGAILVDLDADGRDDLLSQNFVFLGYYPGEIGATLGNFVNIQAKGTNEVFWSKAAGDVNNDGNIDVITSLSTDSFGSTGVLRWFSGNGAGGFSAPQSIPSTPYPIHFTLGDFDADGDLDAAATGPQGGAAFVFPGTGNGFSAPQPIAPSGAEARYLATGDFDADGIDDLVGYQFPSNLVWFRGGAAGLTVAGSYTLAGATTAGRDLVTADIEGDGDHDVFFVESVFGNGRLWRALGSPGSGLASPSVVLPIPCSSVAAFEFDGHPGLDLVYTEISVRWPTLIPNDGAGGYLTPVDISAAGSCTDTDSACAGDLDRDGVLDLAFESALWRRGVGDGTFHPAAPINARPSELVDMNGDGRLDSIGMLTTCGAQNGLYVALQSGLGNPSFGASALVSGGNHAAFCIVDLDADGDLDLVSAPPAGLNAHLNNGVGDFTTTLATGITGPTISLGAGDLNGDGLDDIARTNYLLDFFQQSVTEATLDWGLSVGNGSLAAIQSKDLFLSRTAGLVIEDFDGDGFRDVAWVLDEFNQIFAAIGDGGGNLGSMIPLSTQEGAAGLLSLAVADIDGDGQRDLIGGGNAGGQVGIARGTGGTYPLWRQISSGAGAGKILPYDFDADGQIDIAWANGGAVRIAMNLRDDPAGTAPFGSGTPGCRGRVSIGAVQPAKVGNGAFRLLVNHVPPSSPGWFLVSTGSSIPGFDPFAVGAILHVDPLPPSTFAFFSILADTSGQASVALPIPAVPVYAGLSFTAQVVHSGAITLGHDCSTSPLSLVSSRAMALTIQP